MRIAYFSLFLGVICVRAWRHHSIFKFPFISVRSSNSNNLGIWTMSLIRTTWNEMAITSSLSGLRLDLDLDTRRAMDVLDDKDRALVPFFPNDQTSSPPTTPTSGQSFELKLCQSCGGSGLSPGSSVYSNPGSLSPPLSPFSHPFFWNFAPPSPTSPQPKRIQPEEVSRRPRRPQRECRFCKNNGEAEDTYTSHTLRCPVSGQLICPVLRALVCSICGATGDKAHTRNYCPRLTRAEKMGRALPAQLGQTKRNARGKRNLASFM